MYSILLFHCPFDCDCALSKSKSRIQLDPVFVFLSRKREEREKRERREKGGSSSAKAGSSRERRNISARAGVAPSLLQFLLLPSSGFFCLSEETIEETCLFGDAFLAFKH